MRVVYFAQAPHGGPIKIGNSYKAGRRLAQISDGLPYELVLVGQCEGALFRERFVQCWFQTNHIRGEWFGSSPELWRWMLEAQSTNNLVVAPPEPDANFAASAEQLRARLEHRNITLGAIAQVSRVREMSVRTCFAKSYITSRTLLAASMVLLIKDGWRFPGWSHFRFLGEIPKKKTKRFVTDLPRHLSLVPSPVTADEVA